jgi:hypothetical protein
VFYSAAGVPPGAVFSNGTGGFFWSPTIGQAGSYNVVITATNTGASSTCAVPITVTPRVVPPPILVCPGNQSVSENATVQFSINATDPTGLPIAFTLANPPPVRRSLRATAAQFN